MDFCCFRYYNIHVFIIPKRYLDNHFITILPYLTYNKQMTIEAYLYYFTIFFIFRLYATLSVDTSVMSSASSLSSDSICTPFSDIVLHYFFLNLRRIHQDCICVSDLAYLLHSFDSFRKARFRLNLNSPAINLPFFYISHLSKQPEDIRSKYMLHIICGCYPVQLIFYFRNKVQILILKLICIFWIEIKETLRFLRFF